jgi:methyl-accepting chemotaxis protein
MSEWFGDRVLSVGILGGGRGGSGLLAFFRNVKTVRLVFLTDGDPGAAGIQEARGLGIATFAEPMEALQASLPDLVFDTTGSPEIEAKVQQRLQGTGSRLVPALASRLLVEVQQLNSGAAREAVGGIVGEIQRELGHSLDTSTSVVNRINSIMSTMQMLALNASIEAAKAGVHGRGFSVVAEHLGKSVDAVRNLTQEINQVNQNIIQVAQRSEGVLEKLG